MKNKFATLHIVYENCDVSVIPYDQIRFLFFDKITRCSRLQNWNLSEKPEDFVNELFERDYFESGSVILTEAAGKIPTHFSVEGEEILTKKRLLDSDISQFSFLTEDNACIATYVVDYQSVSGVPGESNMNQRVYSNADGDIYIQIKETQEINPILVRYHEDAARKLGQAHPGEWCDLRSAYDVEIKAGERYLINLGVSIKVPDGYESIMAPRSSTFKNYGLLQTNSIGVFDEKYCGNNDKWYFPCYATRDASVKAGDRIAQFRIQPIQGLLIMQEVEEMPDEDRGGLGSTGIQ